MRRGFSLLTAVVFLILVATLGSLALSMSSLGVKQTSDIYLREQAELLLQSGTEYALLAISAHDINKSGNCLNSIDAEFPPYFDINITIWYMGNGLPTANGKCNILDNTIVTPESNVTVIMDTFVSLKEGVATEPIRLHRRTLQKP